MTADDNQDMIKFIDDINQILTKSVKNKVRQLLINRSISCQECQGTGWYFNSVPCTRCNQTGKEFISAKIHDSLDDLSKLFNLFQLPKLKKPKELILHQISPDFPRFPQISLDQSSLTEIPLDKSNPT